MAANSCGFLRSSMTGQMAVLAEEQPGLTHISEDKAAWGPGKILTKVN